MIRCAGKWHAVWVEFLPDVLRATQGTIGGIQLGIYISIILLHSNTNNFHYRLHRVDSKVARAASKVIRVAVVTSRHDF